MTLKQVIETLNKAQWQDQQVQCINLYTGGPEDIEIIYMAPKENIQVNEESKNVEEPKAESKEESKAESKEIDEPQLNKGENK